MSALVHVDLDEVLDVAIRGVRRASVFMGLGVNAALSPELNNYQLTNITNIQLSPSGISDEELINAKGEFRLWVEANGFRELIETFIAFLDEVHLACLKFEIVKGGFNREQFVADQFGFSTQSFPNKLNILQQKFGVVGNHRDHQVTLNGARNVFTHRLSLVGRQDLNAGEFMCVSWVGADVYVQESNGQRHPVSEVIEHARIFPEETRLLMHFAARERHFKIGERLELSSRDLAEICLFMSNEAKAVWDSLIARAKALGVEVRGK